MVIKNLSMVKILWKLNLTHNDLPLNKQLKFPTMTIIARSVFEHDDKYYPQVYLDEWKMIQYERIDISREIDINKTDVSKNVCCVIIGIL